MIRRMLALLILAAFMVVMAALPALAAPPPQADPGLDTAQCAINAAAPGAAADCVATQGPPAP